MSASLLARPVLLPLGWWLWYIGILVGHLIVAEAHLGQHTIIEFACDERSLIGVQGALGSSLVKRFTVHGPDLSTRAGLDDTVAFARAHPGSDLWGSLPCTTLSAWQHVNCARLGEAFKRRLDARRGLLLRMLRNFVTLALLVYELGGTVSFEWPKTCYGWRLKMVIKMLGLLPFGTVLVDGCTLGMVNVKARPIQKGWRIVSTSMVLLTRLSGLRCTRDHGHGVVSGASAYRSGFYFACMARIVTCALREDWHSRAGHELGEASHCAGRHAGETCCRSCADLEPIHPIAGSDRVVEPNACRPSAVQPLLRPKPAWKNTVRWGDQLDPIASIDSGDVCFSGSSNDADTEPESTDEYCYSLKGVLALLKACEDMVGHSAQPFSMFTRRWLRPANCRVCAGRRRDLLPLPPLTAWPFEVSCPPLLCHALRQLTNFTISALTFPNSSHKDNSRPSFGMRPTAIQRESLLHICRRSCRHYHRVSLFVRCRDISEIGFGHFEATSALHCESPDPLRVDWPLCAGTCDPSLRIPAALDAHTQDSSVIFRDVPSALDMPWGPEGRRACCICCIHGEGATVREGAFEVQGIRWGLHFCCGQGERSTAGDLA